LKLGRASRQGRCDGLSGRSIAGGVSGSPRGLACMNFKPVAYAGVVDDAHIAVGEFFAKVIDMNPQHFTKIGRLLGPNKPANLVVGHETPGVLCEGLQDCEFRGSQF